MGGEEEEEGRGEDDDDDDGLDRGGLRGVVVGFGLEDLVREVLNGEIVFFAEGFLGGLELCFDGAHSAGCWGGRKEGRKGGREGREGVDG